MSIMAVFFFIFTTLSTIVSGYLLARYVPTACGKRFGMGLVLIGVAFAIWSAAIIIKPADTLPTWLAIGLVPLLAALVYLSLAGTSHYSRATQLRAAVLGIAGCLALLVVRTFFPSDPHFSSNGFFYFGQHPYAKFVTIALLCATILPAVLALASEIRQYANVRSANLFIGICITELIGSVLLLSNNEDDLLFFVGWSMGFGFLLLPLLAAGLFGKPTGLAAGVPSGSD